MFAVLSLAAHRKLDSRSANLWINHQVADLAFSGGLVFKSGDYVQLSVFLAEPRSAKIRAPKPMLAPGQAWSELHNCYHIVTKVRVRKDKVVQIHPAFRQDSASSAAPAFEPMDRHPAKMNSAPEFKLDSLIPDHVPEKARALEVTGVRVCTTALMDGPGVLLQGIPKLQDWAPEFLQCFLHVQKHSASLTSNFSQFHVYTDGSAVTVAEEGCKRAAWAFVVVGVHESGEACFLGYQAGVVAPRGHQLEMPGLLQAHELAQPDAFAAEVEAAFRALVWILQHNSFHTGLTHLLISDALSAIKISAGKWANCSRGFLNSHVRPLEKFACSLGSLTSAWSKAHAGVLFNELADHIAKQTAASPDALDLCWPNPIKQQFVDVLPWLWMHARAQVCDAGFEFEQEVLSLPQPPCTQSQDMAFWPEFAAPSPANVHLDFEVTTFNVNTLQQWTKCRAQAQAWTSRTELLRQQAQSHAIVCLQETRSRKVKSWQTGAWFGYSSASVKGQGGCEVWLRSDLPIGSIFHDDASRQSVFLTSQYCTIDTANARLLVVRVSSPLWKCLLFRGMLHMNMHALKPKISGGKTSSTC